MSPEELYSKPNPQKRLVLSVDGLGNKDATILVRTYYERDIAAEIHITPRRARQLAHDLLGYANRITDE